MLSGFRTGNSNGEHTVFLIGVCGFHPLQQNCDRRGTREVRTVISYFVDPAITKEVRAEQTSWWESACGALCLFDDGQREGRLVRCSIARAPEAEAGTVGMFQVESRAQTASLPQNNPEKFYDVVIQVAIIRPEPIVGKMMHPDMRRRQKKEEISYPILLWNPC